MKKADHAIEGWVLLSTIKHEPSCYPEGTSPVKNQANISLKGSTVKDRSFAKKAQDDMKKADHAIEGSVLLSTIKHEPSCHPGSTSPVKNQAIFYRKSSTIKDRSFAKEAQDDMKKADHAIEGWVLLSTIKHEPSCYPEGTTSCKNRSYPLTMRYQRKILRKGSSG